MSKADPKRTFEATAFPVHAARLHPVRGKPADAAELALAEEAGEAPSGLRPGPAGLKPDVILRLIRILKDL